MSDPVIEIDTAVKKIASGALLVDVRTVAEFCDGTIPGALNIPVDELERRISEITPGTEIVVYCAAGRRAERAKTILAAHGFSSVTNGGGIASLVAAMAQS